MNLYQLTSDYLQLMELLYSDADEETVMDTLESLEDAIEYKADNYAKIIREIEGNINTLKDEETRLKNKRQALERNIERLKDNLYNSMKATGKTKFKTDLFSFNIAKNGGKAPVVIGGEVPDSYCVVTMTPDKKLIRGLLEQGVELPFATLGERGESLRIR